MNVARFSKAIFRVQEVRDLTEIPRAMIEAAAQLFHFDAAGYNEFDAEENQARIYHTCGKTAVKLLPAFNALVHEHPTYEVIKGNGGLLTPVRWSDFVTLR